MQYSVLPDSKTIGISADAYYLGVLMEEAFRDHLERVIFIEPAKGGPHSCRLFFQAQVPGITSGVYLRRPYSGRELAEQLLKSDELRFMRYDPPEPPTPDHKQGWEVRVADILGERIIIVHATWVE